jgi:hypothetical protein
MLNEPDAYIYKLWLNWLVCFRFNSVNLGHLSVTTQYVPSTTIMSHLVTSLGSQVGDISMHAAGEAYVHHVI